MAMPLINRRHLASTYTDYRRALLDAAFIVVALVLLYFLTRDLDWFEWLHDFTRAHEDYELDEIITIVLLSTVGLIAFGLRRIADQKREIRVRQRAEDHAQRLALADALTGLPNRRQFEARLAEVLAQLAKAPRPIAVMMIDLDRFKPINDVFGHSVGDDVLVAFASRAQRQLGEAGTLARFGGDEFAFLLTATTVEHEPARVARRLLALFERPFDVGELRITLGASIGIALAPVDGATGAELMRCADIALYRAKSDGRGTFRFFEPEMDDEVKRRARLERDLRLAIADGSVGMEYQPIVDLRTREVTAFEALARWRHPELGIVPPSVFVGIAEDGGFIVELSDHLLKVACREAASWPTAVSLCFNLSRLQLGDPGLIRRIVDVIDDTGLKPERLELEISEDALAGEIHAAKPALAALREAGIRVALDDFGTGNSSLHYIREHLFDRVKIDGSFVRGMPYSPGDAVFVHAIASLSRALGLTVTAEGIEDATLIDALIAEGCDQGQGFSFGGPMSAADARRLISAERGRETAA
jgi:diguanylate cyclase (GGDEF)-like protein